MKTLTDHLFEQVKNNANPDEVNNQIKDLIGVYAGMILDNGANPSFDIIADLDFDIRVTFEKLPKQTKQ